MPCYQENLLSVAFKAENLALLEKAGKAKGLYYQKYTDTNIVIGSLRFDSTTNTITGNQSSINSLKRAYSREVIKKTALKNNWKVSTKTTNKYVAIKY